MRQSGVLLKSGACGRRRGIHSGPLSDVPDAPDVPEESDPRYVRHPERRGSMHNVTSFCLARRFYMKTEV